MSAPESERRRVRVLAVLDTTGLPPPSGTRPSTEEIRRWIDGQVSTERAAEIDAHTAIDPRLHAEWLALRLEALDGTALRPAARAPSRASRRRQVALAAALTVGAGLGALATLIAGS